MNCTLIGIGTPNNPEPQQVTDCNIRVSNPDEIKTKVQKV